MKTYAKFYDDDADPETVTQQALLELKLHECIRAGTWVNTLSLAGIILSVTLCIAALALSDYVVMVLYMILCSICFLGRRSNRLASVSGLKMYSLVFFIMITIISTMQMNHGYTGLYRDAAFTIMSMLLNWALSLSLLWKVKTAHDGLLQLPAEFIFQYIRELRDLPCRTLKKKPSLTLPESV